MYERREVLPFAQRGAEAVAERGMNGRPVQASPGWEHGRGGHSRRSSPDPYASEHTRENGVSPRCEAGVPGFQDVKRKLWAMLAFA
jgi:hypothetical protein